MIIIEISTVLNIVFELDCKKVKKLKNKEYTVVLREINVLGSSSLRFFELSSA